MENKYLTSLLLCLVIGYSYAQNCPDDINNSPGNSSNTIQATVYDDQGNFFQLITCEATGNSNQIDCDLASYNLPSGYFMLIEISNGPNSTTCAYDANGELLTNNPLPVELSIFNGVSNDGIHHLEWETESEHNNSHFTLYTHDQFGDWMQIAEVEGKGSTSKNSKYGFEYRPKHAGIAYYKLEQTDFNGANKELSIISLDYSGHTFTQSSHGIYISSSSSIRSVKTYTLTGKILDFRENISEKEFQLEIYNNKVGKLRLVKAVFANGDVVVKKFVM